LQRLYYKSLPLWLSELLELLNLKHHVGQGLVKSIVHGIM